MWPIESHKYFGIFVKEQVEGLNKYYPEVKNNVIFINGRENKLNYLLSILKVNWHLLQNKYDLVHIHFGLSGLFLIANPFLRIPVITMLHSADIDIAKSNKLFILISKLVVGRSKHVFYLNQKMNEILGKCSATLEYLPCGVNTNDFQPTPTLTRNSSIKIAFPASSKRPEKNYKLFKEIIDLLHDKHNILAETVEIHDKSRTEVCEILNSVDIVLMTSISEGSPQIIKEAMSCNRPVVSSAVGDVAYLLENVKNSYVIDSYNAVDYLNPILNILKQGPETEFRTGGIAYLKLVWTRKKSVRKYFLLTAQLYDY